MDKGEDTERRARARARGAWPVRVASGGFGVGADVGDDIVACTTAEQRLGMAWALSLEAFSLAGRCPPPCRRQDTPSRLYRPGEPRIDVDA